MALIQYNNFYRMYGIRRLAQMVSPPLPLLSRLSMPANSYYHYIGEGPLDDGPTEDTTALQKNKNRPFPLSIVKVLTGTEGNPRLLPIMADKIARSHLTRNPRFRLMRDLATVERDQQVVGVFNYSLLHRMYRYPRNIYSNYYRWRNIHDTVWTKIAEIASASPRNQFIEFNLPRVLPSVSMFNVMESSMTQKLATVFSYSETLILLELWKWLGPNRDKSLLSKIDPKFYDRVNLVFCESNRWFVLNLGQLDQWRLPTKREIEENSSLAGRKGNEPARMQRYMLRLAMALTAARDESVPENLGNENEDKKAEGAVSTQLPTGSVPEVTTISPTGKTVSEKMSPEKADPVPEPEPAEFVDEIEREEREEKILDAEAQVIDQQPLSDEEVFDTSIDADLESLATIADNAYGGEEGPETVFVEYAPPEAKTPEEAIIAHANALADAGGWPATEYRRAIENAGRYKQIVAPDGTTLGEFLQIKPEMTQLTTVSKVPDRQTIADKTMLQSSLLDFDRRYVRDVMQRDVANMVVSLQNAGVMVTDYRVNEIENITGGLMEYAVKVKPLQGVPSTLRFKIPRVEEDGSYRINGVVYRTRKQRGDLPIRKLTPTRVALTSYYGKAFVERSSKKVNDYGRWLRDNIVRMALADNPELVTYIEQGDAFDPSFEAPRLYTMIAQGIRAFNLTVKRDGQNVQWKLLFDHKRIKNIFAGQPDPEGTIEKLEQLGKFVIIGIVENGRVLLMDKQNAIYESNSQGTLIPMPALDELLGLAALRCPVEFAELRVFGKMIPVGVVLSYLMGIDELCKRMNVKPRVVPAGQRASLAPGDWTIVFQDETWVFNRDDVEATLVLGGWRDYRETTLNYNHHEFNRRDVYYNVLEENGLSVRYLRELDLMAQMFIDPITKELLAEMKEPQVWTELLVRAAALLATDQHPHELDANFLRIKGYERFPGLLYSEMVRSLRVHNAKGSKAMHPLEINPYAVWIAISEDPAKDQSLEINPIKELKEIEAVTYAGTGGRSGRSMVKRTRAYHPSDTGVISEATSDSSDVGINTFLTADPKFKNLRGMAEPYELGKSGATSGLSTTALASPAIDRDDMKRANFASIQQAHGIACDGYHQAQVRTGYEQVIPYRVGPTYCVMAKKNGQVTSLTATGIIVTYADGEVLGVEIGRKYGNAAGLTVPHEIVTTLKLGDSFNAGDPIAYNSGFFEPDFFNPKQIVWKCSTNSKTALLESTDTLEDSCAISVRLSNKLRTRITKLRTIVVNFDQQVHRVVKVGDKVEYDSILCMIEDAVTASSGVLDESTIDTLRVLTAQAPQAKILGTVERVEIFYHGEKEDMSPTLRALVTESDQKLTARLRSQGKKVFNGRVDENFRVENDALQLDSAAINVYISTEVAAGVGDKGVFGNQLKTVFGRVFSENVRTESGIPIDSIFGAISVDNRIVMSPYVIGTTATLLNVIAKKAVQMYNAS